MDGSAHRLLIRPASQADAAAIVALWTECFTDAQSGSRQDPYTLEDYRRAETRGDVFVAEADRTVVGVVVLLPTHVTATWVADGEVEISQLGVSRSARRSGAGRALLRACDRRARELDADAIVLWTGPAHRAAHALYESLGYTRATERDSERANGRRLIYRLVLR